MSKWISVHESMPEPENPVLLLCESMYRGRILRQYQCVGFHVPKGWYEDDSQYEWQFDDVTYDEEREAYQVNECFCERIFNWDDLSFVVINDEVTHWMPLPDAPKEINESDYSGKIDK
jgi:Protein of unknown function (DUF551).